MDDYIPPGNFFTPKRPSFRLTPNHHHQSQNFPQTTRSLHTTPINYNRRYYNNINTPPFVDDHRRMYSNNGGSSYYHQQHQRQYYNDRDRYGRSDEHFGGYKYHGGGGYRSGGGGGYGPFNHGVFTSAPNRLKVERRKGRREYGREEKLSSESSSVSPRSSGESGGSSSSTIVSGVGDVDDERCGGSDVGKDQREIVHEEQRVKTPEVFQSEVVHHGFYDYNTPGEEDRGRRPGRDGYGGVQPIQYNDGHPTNWPQRQGPGHYDQEHQKSRYYGHEQRSFDHPPPPQYHQPNLMYMEQTVRPQQHEMMPPMVDQRFQQGPPYLQYHYGPLEQHGQGPAFQNVNPALLQCFTGQPLVYGAPLKLMDAARAGYRDFEKDFREEQPPYHYKYEHEDPLPMKPESNAMKLPPVEPQVEFKTLKFDVDGHDFIDKRHIESFVKNGEKEYKLFEDSMNPVRDVIREFYNVNDIDHCNVSEICGVKLLPQTMKNWPPDIIGSDWDNLRKLVVNYNGGLGDCGGNGGMDSGAGGVQAIREDYGIGALAKLLVQASQEYPLGSACFIGMNLDKLVRDLDGPGAICTGFAGGLSDRNRWCGAGWSEVMRGGLSEYDLNEGYDWGMRHRIKRSMFKNFSFETLLFIFYTFTADALQLLAAKELYLRGWRFHKIFQVWITPYVAGRRDEESGVDRNEEDEWVSGVYKYFHYGRWGFMKAEFKINGGLLEGEPPGVSEALWD